ncbi:MAG: phosphate/phosphite/phosphonate ABC transporter substrate-binding protein [Gammaproteobacteria bacterium]|nr:phosphate/phosphite/phosphonate ABC transporter substrate-binding protein [Gammaproteobacteria bacterium]
MSALAAAAVVTLVFCAPGYPGGTADAQPYVDQFAKAAAAAAGWPAGSLTATYQPTEEGCVEKLAGADAALVFTPYPFFMEHGARLHLKPIVQADVTGAGLEQRWTLVTKAGLGSVPASLAGYTILSTAGYAPEFVRQSALGALKLPPDVKVESTGQVLSALRRAAAGEPVAVLLDQEQAAALPTLPFAAQLKTALQSSELPVAVVAVVGSRLSDARARSLQSGLLKLSGMAGGPEALESLRLKGFAPPKLPGRPATP